MILPLTVALVDKVMNVVGNPLYCFMDQYYKMIPNMFLQLIECFNTIYGEVLVSISND